jgi:MoxR-like ATPase
MHEPLDPSATNPSRSAPSRSTEAIGSRVGDASCRLVAEIERAVVGKRDAIRLLVVALLAEGHVLIEDVPGVGKTLLAKAVARVLRASFRRIQLTPDLLPSDVTGISYLDPLEGRFRFRPGPIMAHVVLADEINRATPRTQSCLLEAMEERQVTVDEATRPLPRPFVLLATQNPIEQEGTFPLPEAQLDRFLLTLRLGYPEEADEAEILARFERRDPLDGLEPVLDTEELLALQGLCRQVHVSEPLRTYLLALIRTSRTHPSVELGASPRAGQRLQRAAQALAAMEGRDFVLPDDVKRLALPVLAHRLMLRPEARLRGEDGAAVISDLLDTVALPLD